MPRAFTSADVVQTASDITPTGTTVADPGVSLPAATTQARRCGVIILGGGTVISPPEQWDPVAQAGAGTEDNPLFMVMCRADLPVGEQGWPFVAVGGVVTFWAWVAEEWANVSHAPILGRASAPAPATNPGATSLAIGPTGSWDSAEYAAAIAAVLIINGSGTNVWPTVTWSGGFTETNVLTRGTGTASNDMRLHVARKYGAAGDTGAWSTTPTFTGSDTTFKSFYGAMVVFRAEHFVGEA